MAKSGTDEHQRTVAVRKCTNGPCTAAYLAIYSFRQVIRAEIPLVMTGTVALTVSRPLILASTDKFVRLMVEQGIQCFSYAVAYKIF